MYEIPRDTHEIINKAKSLCDKNKLNKEDLYDIEEKVFKPFIHVDYYSEGEEREFVEGENKLSYSKVEVNEQDLELLSNYIKSNEIETGKNICRILLNGSLLIN